MGYIKEYLCFIIVISVIPGVLLNESLSFSTSQSLTNICHNPLPPIKLKNIPADSSLRYVFGIFRHGIRSSVGDPSKITEDISLPSVGKLTKVGKQQLYTVGKQLRKRYSKFLYEYDEDQVTVTSTPKKRNIMSALTLMAGMFPPHESFLSDPDLRWQPIPVDSNTADFDKSYLYGKNHSEIVHEKCPSFEDYVRPGLEVNLSPDLRSHYKQLYELLQYHTGDITMNSINSNIIYSDEVHCACLNGVQPPSWLLIPRPEYKNQTIYPDLIMPFAREWYKNVQYFENNTDMLSYIVGPLINQIQVSFEQLLKKNSLRKMSFHVTHDNIINPLLWFLNTTESINIQPGDGVIFELHLINNTTCIKVFHYDANKGHILSELELENCPSPCSYEEFAMNYKGITPEQWMKKCKL